MIQSVLITERNMFFILQLERKSQKNFALAKSLRERIEQLWDRLDISSSERSSFSAKCAGYRPKVIKMVCHFYFLICVYFFVNIILYIS